MQRRRVPGLGRLFATLSCLPVLACEGSLDTSFNDELGEAVAVGQRVTETPEAAPIKPSRPRQAESSYPAVPLAKSEAERIGPCVDDHDCTMSPYTDGNCGAKNCNPTSPMTAEFAERLAATVVGRSNCSGFAMNRCKARSRKWMAVCRDEVCVRVPNTRTQSQHDALWKPPSQRGHD